MPRLEGVQLINAAGFDEVRFPVGGHSQIIGVNGHGKSTLLRTVLFFYLGTNEKAPYALQDTKSDFVSHYLGDPPGYLIYEVGRGDGKPSYHIAVTRPATRIQFHFVDAPFSRDFYVDGKLVLPLDRVQERWRDARCAVDTLLSYEDFTQRIYGIVPSTFAVFRPAARSGGQVSVLPRIISGIFTVSQLDADKLKSALTCGLRSDASAAELDLAQLKNQLEHFRRMNRAVKTYVRHEQDAVNLVELAASFEAAQTDRKRAIEGLVRAARLLSGEARALEAQREDLQREEAAEEAEFVRESGTLSGAIQTLGEEIAVLDRDIGKAKQIASEYVEKQIEQKARELDGLPEHEEERRLAEREHTALTGKFADENRRKEQLLANVRQSWAALSGGFQERRLQIAEQFRKSFTGLDAEKETACGKVAAEQASALEAIKPKRAKLDRERTVLSEDYKTHADLAPPREIAETDVQFRQAEKKQSEESARQKNLRSELSMARERAKTEREKLDGKAAEEKARIEAAIGNLDSECVRATVELEAFDASLAHFFQTRSPRTWPDAAKTLRREMLFHDAQDLAAKISPGAEEAVWGIKLSTAKLPDATDAYDRAWLTTALRDLRKKLATEKDALNAAHARYLTECDAQEKRNAQAIGGLEGQLDASVVACGQFGDEATRLENHLVNLRSQFETMKQSQRAALETREMAWKVSDEKLREEERGIEQRFKSLRATIDEDFKTRREKLSEAEAAACAEIEHDEVATRQKRDDEIVRIEQESQRALSEKGANAERVAAAQKRLAKAEEEIERIGKFRGEVAEYRGKKVEWMDRQSGWESERHATDEIRSAKKAALKQFGDDHTAAKIAFAERRKALEEVGSALQKDKDAVARFAGDRRFLQEWGYFERDNLPPASFHQPGAACAFLAAAESAHQSRHAIVEKGDAAARAFLRRFDSETLDRKLLGFSPIHEHFDWFFFVGSELKPFHHNRAITGMKRLQTQQFEQLIHNICNKNAAFADGIRQVNQTADSVQANLATINFVDVLDSVELKVERKDNQLIRTLEGFAKFEGLSFREEHDLFAKRADRAEIDRAIDHFERLLREIDSHRSQQLSLTDYFDFLIRVRENGHDMGWRPTLDHIGSTGTDYLVKMLIYLSLIEVYRARAIDPKTGSTVHCVLDETGVLAPKYIRAVLRIATERGIILITAGHSQQTTGFEHTVLVRKHGQRFGAQAVLRKILRCD